MTLTAWVLGLVLTANAEPVKLGSSGLTGAGYSKEQLAAFGEHLAGQFRALRVITQQDVASLLGMERQKQLLGCTDQSACMAELSAALGVDGLLLGDVTKLEGTTQLTVRVVASGDGKRLALCSERLASDAQVFEGLERCARRLEVDTLRALGRSSGGPAVWPWVVGAAGIAVLGVGVGLAVSSAADLAVLRGTSRLSGEGRSPLQVKQDGELKQALAAVGFGVGGAALLSAVLGLVLSGNEGGATAAWMPRAAGLGLAWEWP